MQSDIIQTAITKKELIILLNEANNDDFAFCYGALIIPNNYDLKFPSGFVLKGGLIQPDNSDTKEPYLKVFYI